MEIIISIVAKIGQYLVEPIGQQFGYLIHLNSNFENLKVQFQKLGDKRHDVQSLIDEARSRGQEILLEVQSWVEKVDEIKQALQRFIDEDVKANKMCLGGCCPDLKAKKKTLEIDAETGNDQVIAPEVEQWVGIISQGLQRFIDIEDKMCLDLKSRYSLSRKAKKKTLEIDGLLKEAEPFFNKVSYSPPPLRMVSTEVFKHFESRRSIMEKVFEALRGDNINMIAICGMGGIGKTTMAKEVAKMAIEAKLFDKDVMAVVSQNQDLRKIQGQIADKLRLKLEGETEPGRADELYSSLSSKSVLVILDDVWDKLSLEAVGIPFGGQHNKCKILLTSRSEVTCNQMGSHKIFPIKVLSEEEAWNLFREMAGDCVDTLDLHPIAKEVAKECGGLPVAIVTVGRALENKTKVEWIAALEQLKKSIPKNIPGLHSKVYSSIEFSYTYLKSDEAKSCFLLCCLFPADFDIPIEYLVRYGVGRRLFAKIDNVAEARSRVHAMVNDLKRSFLLLDSQKNECVKMHDVVRDVAISITEEHGFLVGCDDKMKEWPEKDTYGNYVAISLFSREMKQHPDGLECPKLELLQLSCRKNSSQTLPANLFQGMKELKVLSMRCMSFSSLPQSIQVLQNLRTLHLEYCGLEDVSAIGALGKLEMLSFLGSKIKELPREMGNLGHLKLLDLSKCSTLQRIPHGLLSSLSQLVELYMGGIVVKWEPLECNGEGNASLAELNSLSHHLMALEIIIPSIKLLPKDLHFKNQMIKFHMYIGQPGWRSSWKRTGGYLFKNTLSLESHDLSDIVESLMLRQLLQKSENLILEKIGNLKNLKDVEYVIDATSDQNLRAAFPSLERLKLSELDNLEKIYDGQFPKRSFSGAQYACFRNLRYLSLSSCHRLKNVFSLSIARGLVQLQELKIFNCDNLEEIFSKEGEDEKEVDMIQFPKLTHISLSILPRLLGFCKLTHPKSPQPSSNLEVARMETNELTKDKMTDNQDIGFLRGCLECVPHSRNYGPMVESNRGTNNKSHGSSSVVSKESNLTKLEEPKARDIDNPSKIWYLFSSHIIECFKNLKEIDLRSCASLEAIFQIEELAIEESHVASVLDQLRKLKLIDLPKLMHIWKKGPERIMGFGNLRSLKVEECNNLTYLFSPSIAKLLVMLEEIEVMHCQKIEEILARAREEEGEEKEIVLFNKVNSFVLMDLPNLKCFCNEANALEWPSLKKVGVIRCPNLRTFVPANIKTPKLVRVYEDYRYDYSFHKFEFKERAQWKGDLNATIEHIFKGKELKVDYETPQQQTETNEKNM